MVNFNFISPIIERGILINGKLIESLKTEYYNFKTSYDKYGRVSFKMYLPQTVSTLNTSSGSLEQKAEYTYTSKGQIKTVQKTNEQPTAFIWNENQTYPIAQIVNANPNSYAYTTFDRGAIPDVGDLDGDGNWEFVYASYHAEGVYGLNIQDDRRCFRIFGDNSSPVAQIRKDLDPTKKYTISFWAKALDNGLTVAGNQIPASSTWKFYEFKFDNASNIVLSIGDGQVYIDDLKLCSSDAQMTTYTYKPLVGMTSQTDPNGVTTYYKYDDEGRLKRVLDKNKKVISEQDYHYAQPN